MSNLTIRLLSAFVVLLIAYFCLTLSLTSRFVFMFAICGLGLWEYIRIINTKFEMRQLTWVMSLVLVVTVFGLQVNYLIPYANAELIPTLLTLGGIFFVVLVGFKNVLVDSLFPWICLHLIGFLIFGVWLAKVHELCGPNTGFLAIAPLFFVVLSMSTSDTGGYFVGRSLGKHKLSPGISPKKTVEGAIGGLLITLLITFFLGPLVLPLNGWYSSLLGGAMWGTALIGDLLFSALKRYGGFKDSSQLIPGHGGVLDRFDSLIVSAPVAVFLLNNMPS